jgi:hypothetical protein
MSTFKHSLWGSMLVATTVIQPQRADAQDLFVTRHIGESITRRLTQAVLPEAEGREPADLATGWVTPSYISLEPGSDFDDFERNTDIYQFVGGLDKRFGSFYVGLSAGYARTEFHSEQSFGASFFRVETDTDNGNFAPYAAWLVNDNIFLTLLAGYAREDVEITAVSRFDDTVFSSSSSFSANMPFTDLSVTGILPVDGLILTGRIGHRFANFNPDDFNVNTLYVNGEVGYRIGRLLPYFRTIYEGLIPDEGDYVGLVFVGAGATYDFSDTFSAGLSYQTELNRVDTMNIHQAVMEVRSGSSTP